MAWSLEIHHIDVRKSGDATLIVARNPTNPVGQQLRSVLIDGGHQDVAGHVLTYITTTAGLASVDALVATHYDRDHLGGLVTLLERNVTTFDNARIYDRGWPGGGPDNLYLRYLQAINLEPTRTRITRAVRASDTLPNIPYSLISNTNSPAVPAGGSGFQVQQAINLAPGWLIDSPQAEILQLTGTNAPTLTCIACNQWVRRPGGQASQLAAAGVSEPENACSLAFLLTFGNFKYYIGGDIEDPQEALIAQFANPTDTAAGRVLVVKASHHGADTASSPGFIQRMRPLAVMVSNSNDNQHRHPAAATVNVLNGYPRNGGAAPPPPPPAPPGKPRRTWFTGYDTEENMSNHFVALGEVAGDPIGNAHRGHVRVDVSEAQAINNPTWPGQVYRGVLAVTQIAAHAFNGSQIVAASQAAAEAALKGNIVDTVRALVDTQASRDIATAIWTLRCKRGLGVTGDYIANMGAMPAGLEGWLDEIDVQEKALARATQASDMYNCAHAAAQIAATAAAAMPGVLAALNDLPGSIDNLATAYTAVAAQANVPSYVTAAQSATDHANQARDILANAAAQIATQSANTNAAVQQILGAANLQQAGTLAAQAISLAEQTCLATGTAIDDLGLAYTVPARAASQPGPQLVASVITRVCGNSALSVAAGAAAGAACGNGDADACAQALRGALEAMNLDAQAAVQSLQEALNGGEWLFTVSYYKAAVNMDVQDGLL
ncbi:hypothetical protein PS3A_16720 [Pseudomonas sp. 3A(2025)]